MKKVLLFCAVFLFLGFNFGHAQAPVSKESYTFSAYNCDNGEWIYLEISQVTTVTEGGFHINLLGEGTGLTTGAKYVYKSQTFFLNDNPGPGSSEKRIIYSRLIGQGGDGLISVLRIELQTTRDANGNIRVVLDNYNSECK